MYTQPDELFFHYTTAEAAFGHIVPTGRLRLSPYRKMRDPLEAQEWGITVDRASLGGSHGDRFYEEIGRRISAIKDETFLLSLTVDDTSHGSLESEPFARGYARASLWDRYAERHEGVCLGFDRARLATLILDRLTQVGVWTHGPVTYSRAGGRDDARAMSIVGDNLAVDDATEAQQVVRAHLLDNFGSLFFTKLLDWQGEQEYRFSVYGPQQDWIFCDYQDALRGVILGEAFPAWQIAAVRAHLDRRRIALNQLSWAHGQPQLLPIP